MIKNFAQSRCTNILIARFQLVGGTRYLFRIAGGQAAVELFQFRGGGSAVGGNQTANEFAAVVRRQFTDRCKYFWVKRRVAGCLGFKGDEAGAWWYGLRLGWQGGINGGQPTSRLSG